MAVLKEWYSVQELAGLLGLPGSEYGVLKWVQKNIDQKNLAVTRPKR